MNKWIIYNKETLEITGVFSYDIKGHARAVAKAGANEEVSIASGPKVGDKLI